MQSHTQSLTKVCLIALPTAALAAAFSLLHSAHAAASVFVGSALMIANVWLLACALSSLLLDEHPRITRSVLLLAFKIGGLFALTWVFLRYAGIHPLWFGASAALTVIALATAFGLRAQPEAAA